jgi:hypothetical protein
MLLRAAAPLLALATLAACSSPTSDPHASVPINPLGQGERIRDVGNPTLPTHAASGQVSISSAEVLWLDNFDETHNGKSLGTLYIQDVGSQAPYSGMSVYQPSYVPSSLRVAPGDVLDFAGAYEELASIGTAIFPTGQVLPQLAKPVGDFRYELPVPTPAPITIADLNDYAKGRQWESMLVTLTDVTIGVAPMDTTGRVNYQIVNSNAVTISNELFDLKKDAYPPNTHFASVTGIVTWFYSYHIAPRSPDDLKQ